MRAYNDAIPIVALTSPYTTSRAHARNEIGRFVEIHVSTLLEVGKPRDGKSLYKQARQREAREMTGVDDLHEDPERSDIRVDAVGRTPEETAGCVLAEFDCLG